MHYCFNLILEYLIEAIKEGEMFRDDHTANQTGESSQEIDAPLLANPRITFQQALYDSFKFAIPFALSRIAIAAQNFGNGVVITQFNDSSALAASPVMFMVQQGITGSARGALSSVNAVVGNLNGQKKYSNIGPAVNQGLALATCLGIPTFVIFFTAKDWLLLMGTSNEVAYQAGEYLRAISYGILPTYWAVVDQQFLLSIKRNISPIFLNTMIVATSMAVGYPFAAKEKSLAWLGYGASIGALLTFIAGRCFLYFNKVDGELDREKYQLFVRSFKSNTPFTELLGLSFPTALQAISEWLPTLLISIITANSINAELTLQAEVPAMQMLMVANQILLGLGTAATVSVANSLGEARTCAEANDKENELICKQNARTIGYADITSTAIVTVPPLLFFAIYPEPVVNLLINNTQVASLANSMLRITGASLLLDGVRNTTTGALLGKKRRQDNFFTSTVNLAITSIGATLAGYLTQDSIGPLSFFIFRMIGIFLTATILLLRWNSGSNPDTMNVSNNHATLFSASRRLSAERSLSADIAKNTVNQDASHSTTLNNRVGGGSQ